MNNDKSTQLREKAKKILQQKGIQDSTLYNHNLESLIEELSIHQIELEQQNEELRRTHNELEISRNKYSELFNDAPNGYFIIRKDYKILNVNTTGAEMIGMPANELSGKPFTQYIHFNSQDTFYFHLKNVLNQKNKGTCELQLNPKHGSNIHVRIESIPVKHPEKPEDQDSIRSAIIDITQQKKDEKKITESEEKYRAIFENSGEG
ncbi:MAG: PAS domain-containing protein, partial [Bacteroidales bacterium]